MVAYSFRSLVIYVAAVVGAAAFILAKLPK
jgi:hypothetical protein